MRPTARQMAAMAATIFCAALLQMDLAYSLRIGRAQPDFIILFIVLTSMFCDANGGAALGFWGGLLTASVAAPPHSGFGGLIVSRTLIGFAIGWLEARVFRDHPLLAIVLVAAGTFLAEALFFLFAPQHNVARWARVALVLPTLYNAALALPFYFLVRRFARPVDTAASN
jgi:cell shape-determining protein MreD